VWPTALRFLRIDEGHEILEKDGEAGYVVFAVDDDGKRFHGTLEVIRVTDGGQPAIRLVVAIEDRPAYMEQGLLDRLLVKLRGEHGPPPAPSRPAPSKPAPSKPAPSEPAPPDDRPAPPPDEG
jgi:hypothetical protein